MDCDFGDDIATELTTISEVTSNEKLLIYQQQQKHWLIIICRKYLKLLIFLVMFQL